MNKPPKRQPAETRQKLVDATVRLMLHRGFPATTVDEICAEAGLTKGSFFHYFHSKEEIGQAALARWAEYGMAIYADAWEDPRATPLEQIRRLFGIMIGLAQRPEERPLACLVGMLSQEMAVTNSTLREACSTHLATWSGMVHRLLAEAKATQKPRVDFDPEEVAWFVNSLWQGSMLIAKTRRDPQIVVRNLERGRTYIDDLFGTTSLSSCASKTSKRKATLKTKSPPNRRKGARP